MPQNASFWTRTRVDGIFHHISLGLLPVRQHPCGYLRVCLVLWDITGQDKTKTCCPMYGVTLNSDSMGLSGRQSRPNKKPGRPDKIGKSLNYPCQIKTLKHSAILSSAYLALACLSCPVCVPNASLRSPLH